jgi:hypothetical protein
MIVCVLSGFVGWTQRLIPNPPHEKQPVGESVGDNEHGAALEALVRRHRAPKGIHEQ